MKDIKPQGNTIRNQKEKFLHQHAKVIWFTGLPCSGKTTLAINFEKKLFELNYFAVILDGDLMRTGLSSDLGFSATARTENIRRIAEVAKQYVQNGIIVLVSLVSPYREMRMLAKEIIGEDDFMEVFVNASLMVCEQRDIKGMYEKARNGLIKQFTGIDSAYEIPDQPFMEILTEKDSIEASVSLLTDRMIPLIKF
ncbi:MAG: adenylyl-sulfate kinase [Bacteroidales bacterium]